MDLSVNLSCGSKSTEGALSDHHPQLTQLSSIPESLNLDYVAQACKILQRHNYDVLTNNNDRLIRQSSPVKKKSFVDPIISIQKENVPLLKN